MAQTLKEFRPVGAPAAAVLDHLIIGAESLAHAVPELERFLGVPLSGGGKHVTMGTHNRLLRLGPEGYLEVLAIDPEGTPPDRPRWVGLDEPATRSSLAAAPRLLHWSARVERTELPELPLDIGPFERFQRGDFGWQLTVRGDGQLAADGVVPSLIRWEGPHPVTRLPDVGVTLEALELEHPRAAEVQAQLDLLGLPYHCSTGPAARITAQLRTPAGTRTLRSTEPIR
jgi:glyoxalase-like protein